MSFLIHQQLEIMAQCQPHRLAVRFLDESLTYQQLDQAANQLARVLISSGVVRHARVGIYMDKSLHTAVALYGIMKAGAVYVPLDPSAPVSRLHALTVDCDIRHMISAPAKKRKLIALGRQSGPVVHLIGVDRKDDLPYQCVNWAEVAKESEAPLTGIKIIESDLAYIIYTSGSTGAPKGIMHTHHSGLSFARWAAAEYGLTNRDRLSNHAPLHFDLSVFDYFAAVTAGAATIIVPEEYTKIPASYSQLLADQQVTVLFTVPFALIQMLLRGSIQQRDLGALRWAIFGGEPFPSVHLRALCTALPHVKFDNMYGPAEVNGCTHYTVQTISRDDEPVPIGPMACCAESRIVDADNHPVAPGEVGELLVRTPTMMRGYWKREELNRQVFEHRTNAIGQPEIFFRTGDLVQELENGILRFVGRKDRQVKVRGYRVELDEIELALTSLSGVEEAAVYTLNDNDGSKSVCAEVTLRPDISNTETELTRQLKSTLPWYAIPTQLTIVNEFPRGITGKINRRLLCERAQQDFNDNNKTAWS